MFGALHWHLFGPSYQHPFERFSAEYTVLDTAWRIHCELPHAKKKSVQHTWRPIEICGHYDISLPPWLSASDGKTDLARLRNELFHEGLWGEQPIGFAHPTEHQSIHIELFHFNSRVLLAILGERSEYTRSLYNRQRWALD
jgi:hypothetical protein